MHFVYGFCDGSANAAVEEYQDVTPKGEFRLEAYLHVFTRHCVTMVVFQA